VSGQTTAPAGGQQGQAGGQDSDTLKKLREKVREQNALSASHRKGKGGKVRGGSK
jgi:hypothetical protein